MEDWRLQGQEKYLQNAELALEKYKKYREDWDHDHCEFCSAKFSEDIPDTFNEGYTTLDNYRWICENCFNDFKEKFNWKVVKKNKDSPS